MRGVIIGALRFDRMTLRCGDKYVMIYIKKEDIQRVKDEFGVTAPSQLIDKPIQLNPVEKRIYAVHEEEMPPNKKSKGVECVFNMA